MAARLKWGLLATGNIADKFCRGVQHSKTGQVVAVGSRRRETADAFAAEHDIPAAHGSYEELLADPEVEAVYISTPHPMHVQWCLRAAEAGKHILCEKPLGLNYWEAVAAIDAARRHDVFLMEAFMYRCNPQTAKLVELIREGVIGEVKVIRSSFSFHAPPGARPRLDRNDLGGGGILDVGCYPVSLARLVAGVALGGELAEPLAVKAAGHVDAEHGVDEYATAVLAFENDICAQVACGMRLKQDYETVIWGSDGHLTVPQPWFGTGREGGRAVLRIDRNDGESREQVVETDEWLYGIEADTVARCLAERQGRWPAMSWDDTLNNLKVLDAWRAEIGMAYEQESWAGLDQPFRGGPLRRAEEPPMRYGRLGGLEKPISRLVMGVDNQNSPAQAAAMFDDFFELGGNCFDTARIYGDRELILGEWIRRRGVREEVVILDKGAHTPANTPEGFAREFAESLERLQTEYVDLYMLHRDNPEIPAGEFVDAINEEVAKGRIRLYGGSNWTPQRVEEANAYAARKGLQPMAAVSNNFALARLQAPPWPDSFASSDPESRAWFERTGTPLFPWASQAQGFFVPGRAHPEKRENEKFVACWYCEENFERLRRAETLAREKGVSALNIALAYVLRQPFPTFPLIGPRRPHETWTCLPALTLDLAPEELAWLDLRGER
jgi:predicted dehydrogenase/aryl-alcohol dehydrogenase-like predicted oxidoreductase